MSRLDFGGRFDPSEEEPQTDLNASEGLETLLETYGTISKKISSDLLPKFTDIVTKLDNFFDPNDEEWTRLLSDFESIVNELALVAADEEELAIAEDDVREELDSLGKVAANLSKKHNH